MSMLPCPGRCRNREEFPAAAAPDAGGPPVVIVHDRLVVWSTAAPPHPWRPARPRPSRVFTDGGGAPSGRRRACRDRATKRKHFICRLARSATPSSRLSFDLVYVYFVQRATSIAKGVIDKMSRAKLIGIQNFFLALLFCEVIIHNFYICSPFSSNMDKCRGYICLSYRNFLQISVFPPALVVNMTQKFPAYKVPIILMTPKQGQSSRSRSSSSSSS